MVNISGVAFRVHPLFVLVMALAVATGNWLEIVTLFGIVLIHELGHLAAALRMGWPVREVQLLPFGGVLVTDESGRSTAKEEIAVAIAGPLQHVWLIGAAYLFGWLGWWPADWTAYFISANAGIALFNLLPVLPLDGGRIVMAVATRWIPYYRAVRIGAWIGLAVSAAYVAAAVGMPWQAGHSGIRLNLLMIGLFLFASNWQSWKHAGIQFLRFLMHREQRSARLVDRTALAQPIVARGGRTVSDVVKLFVRDRYHLIYVLDPLGRVSAVLPESRLLEAMLAERRGNCALSDLFVVK
ncbi:M50 family metallopeptidase [Paenibacillus thermoaerophilus]|uniref:M50 family metallopeptidase n=1 Tax=Paenibacillus thermoaerophilus TaxID=1215385 RepID=A0ABW2UWZ1_9BACL|nr:M50 family metallopeptidase [Paenibacillus thermoaerophilus]TMV17287.1 Zn-dependent protease [Paenibacillus thermoaerophilus]